MTDLFVSITTKEEVAFVDAGDGHTQSQNKLSVILLIKFNVKNNISKSVVFISQ